MSIGGPHDAEKGKSMSSPQRKLACIFGRNAEGKILLQMRDSGGGIFIPTSALRWGFFGGHMEGDELPLAAVRREFEEETSIMLDADAIDAVGQATVGDALIYFYAIKRTIAWRELDVKEGAGAGFFTREEMEKIPLTLSAEALIRKFL
jgi:8-oxo-dGTP pyrophosphatase MutT (NUDIX family)